ncbi:MAG: methionyl-tRNA formyltransferase, partial [Pseudomonadota bacterium]
LAQLGAAAMVEVLADLDAYPAVAQDDALATHAAKVDKAEARIDWTHSAGAIERLVRGLAPFPGAWFEMGGERVKLLMADAVEAKGDAGFVIDKELTIACGTGALRPLRLQRAGKPAMDRADFLRGLPVQAGVSVD